MVVISDRTPSHHGDNWWSAATDPLRSLASRVADFFAPTAEAAGVEHAYEINIELPGVAEEDIDVSIDHDVLMVSGEKHFEKQEEGKTYFFSERSYGRFHRSFRLPKDADQDKVDATYRNGLLSICIAKQEAREDTRRVKIRQV